MSQSIHYREALGRLKGLLRDSKEDSTLNEFIGAQSEVLSRYKEIFTPEGIGQLEADDFRNFLMFRNNRHWTGLQRLGPRITRDMTALRKALLELIDENVPVATRLDRLLPNGKARVLKLGKAVLTPILLIIQPERYGVWNGTSEGAMRELGIWPVFERSQSIGERYQQMNQLLVHLADDLGANLWTLDALWWRVHKPNGDSKPDEDSFVDVEAVGVHFGLERHLHDFLLDNWEQTEIGKEWDLVEEGGDIKGYGYERPTDIGKIDLLARHKKEPRWLVIELKRGQTSDDTVGQLLRYMGWVQEKEASAGETVEGLVIALNDDQKLRYALKPVPNVRFMRYEVQFRLVASEV